VTIVKVEIYVIKPEKQQEYLAIMKKWTAYIKKNKEKCKELKSWKLFSQMIGDNIGGYIEMWELESLADHEKFMHRTFHEQREFTASIVPGFTACIVPGTYSIRIWNSVM
jgi:hypothetical protein